MTTRSFSVIRRVDNLVDVLIPKQAGVDTYRLQADLAVDGTFTTIIDAPIASGYLDKNVDRRKLHAVSNRDTVRVVFDPDTFSGGAPTLDDEKQFWLRFVPVTGGAPGTPTAPGLIIPMSEYHGTGRIVFSGTAPNGGSVASSLQADLPRGAKNITIQNNDSGTTVLYVAFTVGGSEIQVAAGESYTLLEGSEDTILVRGSGATCAFDVSFIRALPL